MNGLRNSTQQGPVGLEMFKYTSILFMGFGASAVTVLYSPIIALAGTALFTISAVSLYATTQPTSLTKVAETPTSFVLPGIQSRVLFACFYVSFFLSITIPKSGRDVSGVPITTANLCILIALIAWMIKFTFLSKPKVRIPFFKIIFIFILYGVAAFLIGLVRQNPHKYVVLDFVAFIGFIPVYFMTYTVIRTHDQIKKIVGAIVLSSCLICVYGILQPHLGFDVIAVPGLTEQHGKVMYEGVGRWNVIVGGSKKVYSTFQNGNIFGNHLALVIPFLAGVFGSIRGHWKRVFFLGIFVVAWYTLILTYSRGALVGSVCGVLFFGVIAKKIRVKALLVILLIVGIFFVFLQQYGDRPELQRYDFRKIMTQPDQFSAGRLERAREVLRGFYQLPLVEKLFGLGFGGELLTPKGWRFNYVDNLYLTLLFKMGIIGFGILLLLLGKFFHALLKLRTKISDMRLLGLVNGGIAGLIGVLVHNLADTLWFFPPLSANFWFFAGITMALAAIGAHQAEVDQSPQKAAQPNQLRASEGA